MGRQAPTPEGSGQGGRRLRFCSNAFLPHWQEHPYWNGAERLVRPRFTVHTLKMGGTIHPNFREEATMGTIDWTRVISRRSGGRG